MFRPLWRLSSRLTHAALCAALLLDYSSIPTTALPMMTHGLPRRVPFYETQALQERAVFFREDIGAPRAAAGIVSSITPKILRAIHERRREAAQALAFIDHVVMPVSRQLPSSPGSSITISADGALEIHHQELCFGTPIIFHYRIEFGATDVETPYEPAHPGVNIIRAPKGPWYAAMTTKLQNGWRRMTIDNPVLYRRFTSQELEPAPYQEEAVAAMLKDIHQTGSALAVMAMGSGKTIVAFEVLKKLLEERRAAGPGKDPGVAIIFVNNRQILDGWVDTYKRFYKDAFRVGKLYGAETIDDLTGVDIIFATPSKLVAGAEVNDEAGMESRLAEILGKRRVMATVVDETHHVPAVTNAGIFTDIRARNPDAAMIGLTYTDIRTDDRSVRKFYGHHVSTVYSVQRGQEEGYLVRDHQESLDQDVIEKMGLAGQEGRLFNGDADLDARYLSLCADLESRLGFFLDHFKRRKAALAPIGAKAIFLWPGMANAQRIAEYFRDHGVPFVSLTSKDRLERGVGFDRDYENFRTPNWPLPGQPQPRPAAEGAASSRLLGEGVDIVPTTDIYARDFDSPLAAVQAYGRGLRPAPGKTSVTIHHVMGTNRQPKFKVFLNYLYRAHAADLAEVIRLQTIFRGREANEEEDLAEWEEEDKPVPPAQALFDDPQAQDASHFYTGDSKEKDIPHTPIAEVIDDRYLARHMGFQNVPGRTAVQQMHDYLVDIARSIRTRFYLDSGKRTELRARFYPVFFPDDTLGRHNRTLSVSYTIANTRYTQQAVTRIKVLLTQAGVSVTSIDLLFPEMSAHYRKPIEFRARNLTTLRTRSFGEDFSFMTTVLGLARDQDDEAEETLVAIAENQLVKRSSPYPADFISATQEAVMEAYLHHPFLKGHLSKTDFALTPGPFEERLKALHLIRTPRTIVEFFQLLTPRIKTYLDWRQTLSDQDLKPRRKALLEFLAIALHNFPADAKAAAPKRLEQFQDWMAELKRMNERPETKMSPADREIVRLLNSLWRRLRPAQALRTFSAGDMSLQVNAGGLRDPRKITLVDARSVPIGSVVVMVQPDALKRPHFLLLTKPYHAVAPDIGALETVYENLTPEQRSALIAQTLAALVPLAAPYGPEVVYVVPADPLPESPDAGPQNPRFFSDLLDALRAQAGVRYVIGPLRRPDAAGRSKRFIWDLALTSGDLGRSRWPPLNDDQLLALHNYLVSDDRRSFHSQDRTFYHGSIGPGGAGYGFRTVAANLAAVYLAHYYRDHVVGALWERVRERLIPVASDAFDAALYLGGRIEWTLAYFPHHTETMALVQRLLEMLDLGDSTAPPADLTIGLAYLRLVTDEEFTANLYRDPIAVAWHRYSALLRRLEEQPARPAAIDAVLQGITSVVLRVVAHYLQHKHLYEWNGASQKRAVDIVGEIKRWTGEFQQIHNSLPADSREIRKAV